MIHEFASAAWVGKVILDGHLFARAVTGLPSLVVLALNMGLAFLQVSVDSAGHSAKHGATATVALTEQASSVTLGAVLPRQEIDWAQYLRPWLAQMSLMALQVSIALLLSHGSRVCAQVNAVVAAVEGKANAR